MLSDSVGAGGRNRPFDVRLVQVLLTEGGWHLGLVDGLCGRRTLNAILAFQGHFMHYPDGLIEAHNRSWRVLSHPHHRGTRYRTLNHQSADDPSPMSPDAGPAAQTPPVPQGPVTNRTVPDTRAIQLTVKDVLDLKKTLQTEWVAFAGAEQAYGIIDTILNRLASGHWGKTVADVVNARKQFSDINGPPAWDARDHIGIGRHDRVEQLPTNYVTARTDKLVNAYLIERARGRPSIVGTNLDYANQSTLLEPEEPRLDQWAERAVLRQGRCGASARHDD